MYDNIRAPKLEPREKGRDPSPWVNPADGPVSSPENRNFISTTPLDASCAYLFA